MLIIDENLPASLVAKLGPGCIHATALGARLTDEQLWGRARMPAGVILTKDADFFDRLTLDGPPPKVVWVRLGNLKRAALEARVVQWWPQVVSLLPTSTLIEIHADRLEALVIGVSAPKSE